MHCTYRSAMGRRSRSVLVLVGGIGLRDPVLHAAPGAGGGAGREVISTMFSLTLCPPSRFHSHYITRFPHDPIESFGVCYCRSATPAHHCERDATAERSLTEYSGHRLSDVKGPDHPQEATPAPLERSHLGALQFIVYVSSQIFSCQ